MKKLMIVMLGLLTLVSACSDNDDEGSYGVTSGLITPKIRILSRGFLRYIRVRMKPLFTMVTT